MKRFILWAIIKRLTKSESIFPKRGIEAHFRAHLRPKLSPSGQAGDYKTHSVRVLLSVCHTFIKGCTSHWLFLLGLFNVFYDLIAYVLSLCPPPWGVDILFLLFSPSDVRCPMSGVRRPMSGVTHGFRSFKGKVLELLSPNLVCRLIGSVACLGLLLAVVPLLLTE